MRFAVLDNFSSGISVILISKCGISKPVGCGVSAFRMVLKIILEVLVLSEPFPVSNWTFPLKLNSCGNRQLEFPVKFDVGANSVEVNSTGGETGSYQRVAMSLSSILMVLTCDQEFFYLPMFAPKLFLDALLWL